MSNFLQGKTPISFLQELCTKRGITPQYDLVANEGAVHEPTFVFKVTAGEFIGTGKGPSKKKAKHNAALSVLNQMTGLSSGQQAELVEDYSEGLPAGVDGQGGNPVGELQEMTQKRLWRPPVYEYSSEDGPPHARSFRCTVKLWKLTAKGTGKSKKLAKRNAAQAMIQTIRSGMNIPTGETEQLDDYDDDSIPLPAEALNHYQAALKEGVKSADITEETKDKITDFYSQSEARTDRIVDALPAKLSHAKTEGFSKVLDEVAKEQKFEVSYVDIQERSQTGRCQCLVELSVKPTPTLCQGSGLTVDEAHDEAAMHALHYLALMRKLKKVRK